ncbi:hypothetical protein BMG03_13755 [Thioclava nitratireducens]|uniref:Uncharacterized protein n=1 Tax=Thioclava nitratireducens TaxID=1915078 RepID=A0ABM6IIV6_9RHOB|nr:hypothetical protein [Thioclava nitratireducens]AQS48739.1 hypothetical protein BMG03_13755 [Thioclava nitratireducens]
MADLDTNLEIASAKGDLHSALMKSLRDRRIYHWQPTQRLAAMIGAGLIGHERHSPDQLQYLLGCVNQLRDRLMSAKV